ncbi:MAG: hypothetical protein ACXAE3_10765 [Candidatus Kariarchaeaceae archaeon]|jgi:hypothetical protein
MSLSNQELEHIFDTTSTELKGFYKGPIYRDDVVELLQKKVPDSVIEAKKTVFVFYAKLLRDNHRAHWDYDLNGIPEGSVWEPMKKLVTAVRVHELKDVKVVRKKGKYHVRDLRGTYFGKMIFQELESLGNKWALSETDYNKVKLACKQLKLSLPEVIEPTTTEKFFGDEEDE